MQGEGWIETHQMCQYSHFKTKEGGRGLDNQSLNYIGEIYLHL